MIEELISRAHMNRASAARYLGVTPRTIRRYIQHDKAPRACIEALRRARWYSPEDLDYAERLAILRGIEHGRKYR